MMYRATKKMSAFCAATLLAAANVPVKATASCDTPMDKLPYNVKGRRRIDLIAQSDTKEPPMLTTFVAIVTRKGLSMPANETQNASVEGPSGDR